MAGKTSGTNNGTPCTWKFIVKRSEILNYFIYAMMPFARGNLLLKGAKSSTTLFMQ